MSVRQVTEEQLQYVRDHYKEFNAEDFNKHFKRSMTWTYRTIQDALTEEQYEQFKRKNLKSTTGRNKFSTKHKNYLLLHCDEDFDLMKYIDDNWAYEDWPPAFWGLKFKMADDTLFKYVNRKGNLKIYDTIPIASYSKNTVILKNGIVWHRISTKYARKMLNAPDQVKLSSILKKRDHDRKITNITGIVWKLYGYGDVSTGIVKKSEFLKKDWKCVIKLWESGTVSGISCYDDLRGKYALSGSNIEFLSIEKRVDGRDDDNGNDFCDALLQCKRFKLTNNWLQLFYNDGKNYLIFKVSKNFK